MGYSRGRDGAETPPASSTISDEQWESLNRRRSARALDEETEQEYAARTLRSEQQRQKREQS
jgi:hypothetical protein